MNLAKRIDAALGKTASDLVIRNTEILSVTTGEWIHGDIAIADGVIVYAGPDAGPGREEIDGTGRFAVPGFIDSHVHVESSHALPGAFEQAVLPRGTTTAVCDPHELANVCGKEAIRYFLECAAELRMDLAVQLSSCVPATPLETAGAELSGEDLREYMHHPCAGGLAEMMNVPGVLLKVPEVLSKLEIFDGKVTDGHAPLVSGKPPQAYIACGVGSDHECSTPEEAMEKIRCGMTVFIREGSVAKNLTALRPILTPETADFVALCTDDRNVMDILESGHMDALIRQLIAFGTAPELAYRAASLSAARYFRMYDRGMIAPGKKADVVLLDDVRTCRVRQVVKSGTVVDPEAVSPSLPDWSFAAHSVKRAPVTAEDFAVPSKKTSTPVIQIVPDSLITNRLDADLPLKNGFKQPLPEKDILKLAVFARHGRNSNVGRGFVTGFGLKRGALASSVGHDSHNLCVTGVTDEDMALAVNTLIECGGGYAAVADGRVLAVVPFPAGGLMSDKSFPEIAGELKTLYQAVLESGCAVQDPFMQLAFLPLAVIPHLKLTDKGLVDVSGFDFLEV